MGLIQSLAQDAAVNIIEKGGLELIAFNDVEKVLDIALQRNLRVLGIDGFRVEERFIIPDMGAIADFSSVVNNADAVNETIRHAREFLKHVCQPELCFDIEFLDDNVP